MHNLTLDTSPVDIFEELQDGSVTTEEIMGDIKYFEQRMEALKSKYPSNTPQNELQSAVIKYRKNRDTLRQALVVFHTNQMVS